MKINFQIILFSFLLTFLLFIPYSVFAVDNPITSSINVSAVVVSMSPAVGVISGSKPFETFVIFKGLAYPSAEVYLSVNNKIVTKTTASKDASFEMYYYKVPVGEYEFSIFAQEIVSGDFSSALVFSVQVYSNSSIVVSGIFIPPTIHADKVEVLHGDTIKIYGRTAPESVVDILINSGDKYFAKQTESNKDGYWAYPFFTLGIPKGDYFASAKSSKGSLFSVYSNEIQFKVGDKNISTVPGVYLKPPVSISVPIDLSKQKIKYGSGIPRGNRAGEIKVIDLPIPDPVLIVVTSLAALLLLIVFII